MRLVFLCQFSGEPEARIIKPNNPRSASTRRPGATKRRRAEMLRTVQVRRYGVPARRTRELDKDRSKSFEKAGSQGSFGYG